MGWEPSTGYTGGLQLFKTKTNQSRFETDKQTDRENKEELLGNCQCPSKGISCTRFRTDQHSNFQQLMLIAQTKKSEVIA